MCYDKGIGGALIIDGVLFDGSTYDAGDFGHHVICSGDDAFDCVCGKKGCFEYHASADGLVRHYHRELSRSTRQHGGDALISSELLKNNAEEVIALVRKNDDIAKQALRRYKEDLSHGLANLITFYNPDTIAIGGGLSQASEIFEGLTQLVDAKTLPATRDKVIILPASLSVDAGPIGAALVGLYYM
jgi:glucokinase